MGIRWPIGDDLEDRAAVDRLPGDWYNANPFLNWYVINRETGLKNYHTGADLNRPGNRDFHAPLYAIADGFVVYAGKGSGTWGRIIVIEHYDPDYPAPFYSRSAHVETPLVKTGDLVLRGQQIASVGSGDGVYAGGGEHFHFDISTTAILKNDPDHWPGTKYAEAAANYVDPIKFIIENKKKGEVIDPMPTTTITALANEGRLVIRSIANKAGADLGRIEAWQVFTALDGTQTNGYIKLADRPGWIAYAYATLRLTRADKYTTENLNRRSGPGTNYSVLSVLPKGTPITVLLGSERNGMIKLADLQGWVSTAYIYYTPPVMPLIENILDMYHGNTISNPALVKQYAPAIFHKATQGLAFDDPQFKARRLEFSGDILFGAFHFGTGADPVLQADHFLDVVKPDGTIALALDVEGNPDTTPQSEGSMTPAQALTFCARIKARTGKDCAIYTRASYWVNAPATRPSNPLWVANASTPPVIPAQWDTWKLQQYDQKMIPGMSGVVDHNRFVGTLADLKTFWVSISGKLGTTPAPSTRPNIPTTATRIGLHVGSHAPGETLLNMAKNLKNAGKPLACLTVIVETGLANVLADYTTVMYRMVFGRGAPDEPYGRLSYEGLNAAGAEKMGYDFYYGIHYDTTQRLDKRVVVKLRNETYFHPLDYAFEIGVMKAANEDGRKVAIFGDSMSSVSVEQWKLRAPALRFAMVHGHYATLNQYGPYKMLNGELVPGDLPVSSPEGYQFYGKWPFVLYESLPADCRPLLIIGETGPSDSSFTRDQAYYISDMALFDQLTRQYPYFVGWCYYTAGQWIGHSISLDAFLPAIEQLVLVS